MYSWRYKRQPRIDTIELTNMHLFQTYLRANDYLSFAISQFCRTYLLLVSQQTTPELDSAGMGGKQYHIVHGGF